MPPRPAPRTQTAGHRVEPLRVLGDQVLREALDARVLEEQGLRQVPQVLFEAVDDVETDEGVDPEVLQSHLGIQVIGTVLEDLGEHAGHVGPHGLRRRLARRAVGRRGTGVVGGPLRHDQGLLQVIGRHTRQAADTHRAEPGRRRAVPPLGRSEQR